MKTFKRIQDVMIFIGLITTIALTDGLDVPLANNCASVVIIGFMLLIIVERENNNHTQKQD